MRFQIDSLFETKFLSLFDIRYAKNKHYFTATRRKKEEIAANLSDTEFLQMLPDAVSCCVILRAAGKEDRLLLTEEFRYPVGQFLLSVPAGLIDPEDRMLPKDEAICRTAKREVEEETGMHFRENDEISIVSSCLLSSPGMTDESNAVVKMILHEPDLSCLSTKGTSGSELFKGFRILSVEEAKQIMEKGADLDGRFLSAFTWIGIRTFLSECAAENR